MTKRTVANKVVLVTGAGGGLGRALCERFGAAGASIAALDLDDVGLAETSTILTAKGIQHHVATCDVTDFAAVTTAVQACRDALGPVNTIINNAGITHRSYFRDTDISVLTKVVDVSLGGTMNVTKVCFDDIVAQGGGVVAISSVAGYAPLLGRTGYSAAKHAMHGFCESLHSEVIDEGVHVLMVAPSFVNTNIEKNALAGDGSNATHARSLVGENDSPEKIANQIFEAYSKEKRLHLAGKTSVMAYWAHKFLPSVYFNSMRKKIKREFEGE